MQLPRGKQVSPISVPSELRRHTLAGIDVTVRPLSPVEDAFDLYQSSHGDPEQASTWTYMAYGPFTDVAAMQTWMEEAFQSMDPLFFTVVSNHERRAIGMASILNADLAHRRLELGHIWYVPEAQRTTANTEVSYLLLREAFEYYQCRRVEWKCDSLNEASRQAAERLGFTFEGVFRNHMIVKGHNRDTAWYAMTDDEWPPIKDALEKWLYQLPRDDSGWPGSLGTSPPS